MDLLGKLLAWSLEPPPKFRFRTPSNFEPVDVGSPAEVLPAFLSCQDRLLRVLDDANGLALDRLKIASPFNQRLRYSVWSSLVINAAHERRHLWQAERVADQLAA